MIGNHSAHLLEAVALLKMDSHLRGNDGSGAVLALAEVYPVHLNSGLCRNDGGKAPLLDRTAP